MQNILIRCDASKEIGFGHIIRCLELAKQLQKHNCNILFAIKPYELSIEKIEEKGFAYTCATLENFDYENWIKELLEANHIDFFIGDIRDGFPIELITYMRKKDILTVAIDEPSPYAKECDICFYPPHAIIDKTAYKGKVYQGLEYVILREEFYQPFEKIKNEVPNVLIMLGGTDPYKLTFPILQHLDTLQENFFIHILIQSSHDDCNQLFEFIKTSNHPCKIHHNITNISLFLTTIDYAIVAFGTIAYELIAKQIPSAYICYDANQEHNNKYFIHNHFAIQFTKENYKNLNTITIGKFEPQMKQNKILDTIVQFKKGKLT